MKKIILVMTVLLTLNITGCAYITEGGYVSKDRYAIVLNNDYYGDSVDKIVYLDQNRDRWDSVWFYTITQGSDLMAYDLFLNLEQADNKDLFRSNQNMSRYRYLPQSHRWSNKDVLPVGFVRDNYRGKDHIGLTCSACHTTQINYKSTCIRIGGGLALADIDTMLHDLELAVISTLNDKDKFTRLSARLTSDTAGLKKDVEESKKFLAKYNSMHLPVNNGQLKNFKVLQFTGTDVVELLT